MQDLKINNIVEEYIEHAYIKTNFNINNKTYEDIDIWWNYVFLPNIVRNDINQYDYYEYNISDFYDPCDFWKLAPKELLIDEHCYCANFCSIVEIEKLDNSHLQNCYAELYAYNNSNYLKNKIIYRINNWRLFMG